MAGQPPRSLSAERVRTWLFAPLDVPARCTKALRSAADQVIWDLEDGVAAAAKAGARAALPSLLAEAVDGGRAPWVRIESPLEAGGQLDLEILRAQAALDRVVLPKADARSLRQLAAVTRRGRWLLIVESARGLWDLVQGALSVPPDVEARLAFGALDYALDLGIEAGAGEEALRHAGSQIVWMSRVLGMPGPIDAVYPRFTDPAGLGAAARRAYALGFAGKLAIHPAQLGPIADAFVPTQATLAWARRVVAAAAAGPGAVAVDGAMVDRPVVERARAVLAASQPHGEEGGHAGTPQQDA